MLFYHQQMDALIAVTLIVLATHRLTVLTNEDRYTRRTRQWVQNRFERAIESRTGTVTVEEWQSMVAYLLSCLWCMSIWWGGAVTLVTAQITHVPLPILVWLASSSVTSLLGGHRD